MSDQVAALDAALHGLLDQHQLFRRLMAIDLVDYLGSLLGRPSVVLLLMDGCMF